jgi:phosphate-selective porin OprO/OprP
VLNGVNDGGSADGDLNDAFDLVARGFVHPFQETALEPLQGLGLGLAVSYGRQDGPTNTAPSTSTPQYRTAGQQIFFTYGAGVSLADDQIRVAPQAYWYWGPFGAMAEWVRSKPTLRLGNDNFSPDIDAWQIAASWVVTGENRTFQGVVPRSSFNPAREGGGFGAWELAARASGFRIDDEVFDEGFASTTNASQEALEWGVGINWYINPFLKLSLDYNDTRFDGGAPEGRDRSTEGVLLSRFQVAF